MSLDNWDPALTDALAIDLLGFSIGGFIAEEIAPVRPAPVRRLILAATGPKGRDAARDAQYDAIVEWGIPDHAALQRLTGIKTRTLIAEINAFLA